MSVHTVSQRAPSGQPAPARVTLLGHSRAVIVEHLQQHGPTSVQELAAVLDITIVGVRRHLDVLRDDGLITTTQRKAGGRGRPATLYLLTDDAQDLFPHGYDVFAGDVLHYLAERGGTDSVREFLSWRRDRDIAMLRQAVTAESLHERLGQLAKALTDAGFSATVLPEENGFALVQNHCAIQDIARDHPDVCQYEASAFAEVLGEDVQLARRSTLAHGASQCVCSVTTRSNTHTQ